MALMYSSFEQAPSNALHGKPEADDKAGYAFIGHVLSPFSDRPRLDGINAESMGIP